MEPFTFQCACCGESVTEIPDIAFDAPLHYHDLRADERGARARLSEDLCVIDAEEFYIRAVCPLPIVGTGKSFGWGV